MCILAVWPRCSIAKQMLGVVMTSDDASSWSGFEWQRRLETLETADDDSSSNRVDSSW